MEEDDLVRSTKSPLAGVGRIVEAHGKCRMGDRPKPRIPKPETKQGCGGDAGYGEKFAGFFPVFCLDDGLLTRVKRNINLERLGLGLAERRTEIAKKLHALGANRLLADHTAVGGGLVVVLQAILRRIGGRRRFAGLGRQRRRCDSHARRCNRRRNRRRRLHRHSPGQLCPDQFVDQIGGIETAVLTDKPHRGPRHFRRDVESVLRPAGASDFHEKPKVLDSGTQRLA